MTRALVVYCHPDDASFVHAVRGRVLAALAANGSEVRLHDLYADDFDPVFSADEHARHLDHHADGMIDEPVRGYAADLRWCDTLVLVYPTWWAGQPAMLKGWIDRVWTRGVAWELPTGADRLTGLLHDIRRIVVVTTHGSSKWVNAVEGEGGKRTVTRSLRAMCHPMTRTHWIALYGIDTCAEQDRVRFLERVERRVERLTRR